jgi:hypothetical protein
MMRVTELFANCALGGHKNIEKTEAYTCVNIICNDVAPVLTLKAMGTFLRDMAQLKPAEIGACNAHKSDS